MKKILSLYLSVFSLLLLSCEAQVKPNDVPLKAEVKNYTFQTVASGIDIPWGMAWLPDGTLLVTEKSGTLYQIKKGIKTKIKNVHGQGGLMDRAV